MTNDNIFQLLKTKLNNRWKTANNKIAFTEICWLNENVQNQLAQAQIQIDQGGRNEQEIKAILSDDDKLKVDYLEDILDEIEIQMRIASSQHHEQLKNRVFMLEEQLEAAGLHGPKTSGLQKESTQTQPVDAAPTHIDLADAAAQFLYWHMERDGYVRWFRYAFSKGQLLNENECWERLTNPILEVLSFADLEEVGILPSGAMGQLISGEINWQTKRVQAEFELRLPDGSLLHKKYEKEYKPAGPEDVLAQTLYSSVSYRPSDAGQSFAEIPFYREQGINHSLQTISTSVTSEALSTADILSDAYRIDFWDALRFLITGIPPVLQPVSMRKIRYAPKRTTYTSDNEDVIEDAELFHSAGPIGLTVQPWLMPEELAIYWRNIRSTAARKRKMPSGEYLAMFRFVLDNSLGSKPRWTLLAKQWGNIQGNKCNPDTLRTVFNAVRAALFPSYDDT